LDTLHLGEHDVTPDTPKEIIEKYLTYQDRGTPEDKSNRIANVPAQSNAENYRKYAEALQELGNTRGMKKVVEMADTMKDAMKKDAERLDLKVSDFGKDRSWAMCDIGKQFYLYKNQNETSDEYRD